MVVAERQFEWQNVTLGQDLNLSLGNNQIHIWVVKLRNLTGSGSPSIYASLLTATENSRASRIVSAANRQHYLGGRVGLRILLSAYTGVVNADLEFGYGSREKPRLINSCENGKLAFNYTLSSGYALYGFSRDRELGVDLEVFPRSIDVTGLAKRIFTADERRSWEAIPEEQKNDAMLACWTRKEAYGKALGVGIRYAMNQVRLFVDLHHDQWRTPVSGLFEKTNGRNPSLLQGVQLGLPVPAAASLMYSKNYDSAATADRNFRNTSGLGQLVENAPILSAFKLHL